MVQPLVAAPVLLPASQQSGEYPRPQLVRARWVDLGGPWEFAYGDRHEPEQARLSADPWGGRPIIVPFPPESPASGIGETGYHDILWYRRRVSRHDLEDAGFAPGMRLLLHFGAVDYRARVWADGDLVGAHEGGHTPFSVDVTAFADREFAVTVRVEDDPLDLEQPRGKQDWQPEPHVIWYHRTSGIWQPVWLEAVPAQHLAHLAWRCDVPAARVDLDYELADAPLPGLSQLLARPRITRDPPCSLETWLCREFGLNAANNQAPYAALRLAADGALTLRPLAGGLASDVVHRQQADHAARGVHDRQTAHLVLAHELLGRRQAIARADGVQRPGHGAPHAHLA